MTRDNSLSPQMCASDFPTITIKAHIQLGYTDAEMAAHRARDRAAQDKRDRKEKKRKEWGKSCGTER